VKIARTPHAWSVSPKQAVAIQRKLSGRIIRRGRPRRIRLIAGVDLAFLPDKTHCVAAVVVWDIRAQDVLEQHVLRRPVEFPYVPGLLSFREAPAILAVLRKLDTEPDAFMFDGQGYAHPRRFGLASHVGLLIDRPSLGCAKSVLVGTFKMPLSMRRSRTPLVDDGECIGMAVRTREKVKPVYVSVGHRISLEAAVDVTLASTTRYRIPEPTRLADKLVALEKTRI